MRRFRPLVVVQMVTLLVLIYTSYWYVQLRGFKKEVAALMGGNSKAFTLTADDVAYSGFPYRLQLVAHNAQLVRAGPDYAITILTSRLVLVRQPWQSKLYLGFADHPNLSLRSRGVETPFLLETSARQLDASLHLSADRVERLSLVLQEAVVTSNSPFADIVRAGELELHAREPASTTGDPAGANSVAELLMRGRQLSLGDGPSATLEGHITVFGTLPDTQLAHWAPHGFIILDRFTLSWPKGKVEAQAKLAFTPEGFPRGLGRLTTTAPTLVRTALAGQSIANLATEQIPPTALSVAIIDQSLQLDARPLVSLPQQLFAPSPQP